jgi:transcriptional regulator with XRE-family HTH domain
MHVTLSSDGNTIRKAREAKGWTRKDLAEAYGRFFHDECISEDTVRMWEDYNKIPKKLKRRHVLAQLLDIPIAALGMDTALDTVSLLESLDSNKIDIISARTRLYQYKRQNHATTVGHMLEDIMSMVHAIHDEVPYAPSHQQKQLLSLLCDYQQFIAGLFRDHSQCEEALHYQNKAYAVAKVLKQSEITALVLWRRGLTYHEQGNLAAAENDLHHALALKPESAQLEGAIKSELGYILAHSATDKEDVNQAFAMFDSAGDLLDDSKKDPDVHFIRFNEERWHQTRASAWLELPIVKFRSSDKAFQELSLVPGSTNRKRRYAYSTYLQARGWFIDGEFPMATQLALDALVVAEDIKSRANINRIDALHQDLKTSSYSKSTAVAELGAQIFKVKHPELFS